MSYTTEKRCAILSAMFRFALMIGLLTPISTTTRVAAKTVPITPPYSIADIDNGTQGSSMYYEDQFHVSGTHAYFCAQETWTKRRIWMTNLAGLVQPLPFIDAYNSCPEVVGFLGEVAIIKFQTAQSQFELWRTDGSAAGTHFLYEDSSGAIQYAKQTTLLNNVLYIGGYGGLWRTDGTPQGTALVTNSVSIQTMVACNGAIFFTQTDLYTYWELWRSDGTAAGTRIIKHITNDAPTNRINQPYPSPPPRYALSMQANDSKIFIADGNHFWVSDGTDAGTAIAAQAFTPSGSSKVPLQLVPYKNQVAFVQWDVASTWPTHYWLWISDGTISGTHPISKSLDRVAQVMTAGDWIYFDNYGSQIWRTDGSEAGTSFITTTRTPYANGPYPSFLTAWHGRLLFKLIGSPSQLMVTDGTLTGTVPLMNLPLDPWGAITASNFVDFNGKLLFQDNRPSTGSEPYISDGTEAGTHLLRDINQLPASINPKILTTVNQRLYFTATDLAHGRGLWVTQGNPNDAVFLHELPINIGSDSSGEDGLKRATPFNDLLLYAAPIISASRYYSDNLPSVLWRSDGTPSGTYTLTDNNTPIRNYGQVRYDGIYSRLGTVIGPYCYFASDYELWRTDGTRAGTTRVKRLDGTIGAKPFVAVNGLLYFVEQTPLVQKLWRSDGSDVGTSILTTADYFNDLVATQQRVFFTIFPSLWTSDGTPTGTVMLQSFGITPTEVSDLTPADNTLFFIANDGTHGRELWKSDGNSSGTTMVKDLTPGIEGTFPYTAPSWTLAPLGAKVLIGAPSFFTASIWVSDGTATGTQQIGDLLESRLGIYGVSPDNRLLFYENTGLWQTDGTVTGTLFITNTVEGSVLTGDAFLFLRPLWPTFGYGLWWKPFNATRPNHIVDFPVGYFDSATLVNKHLVFVGTDGNQNTRLIGWSLPQPTTNGVDLSLQAPTLAPINDTGKLSIHVQIMNSGQAKAQPMTLTLELGEGMTYASDSSGNPPQVQGNQVRWQWAEMSFLANANFNVQLQIPRGNLGARSPFTITLQSAQPDADPSDNSAYPQAWASLAWYLPIVQR